MRIAVSADDEQGLDSVVSPHFGRCPYFIVADLEGREVKTVRSIANPFYAHHQPGQVPMFINTHDVDVMLTGGMGGRAIALFQRFGIRPVTGASGTVRHALEQYLGGDLQGAAPCRESQEHGCAETPIEGQYEQDELGRLREELELLQRQLEEASRRLTRFDHGL
jgi:predicted Fe-Mo cluster-binding NifX family protein